MDDWPRTICSSCGARRDEDPECPPDTPLNVCLNPECENPDAEAVEVGPTHRSPEQVAAAAWALCVEDGCSETYFNFRHARYIRAVQAVARTLGLRVESENPGSAGSGFSGQSRKL